MQRQQVYAWYIQGLSKGNQTASSPEAGGTGNGKKSVKPNKKSGLLLKYWFRIDNQKWNYHSWLGLGGRVHKLVEPFLEMGAINGS